MFSSAFQRYRPLLPALVLVICCLSVCITALTGTIVLDGTTYDFALSARYYGAFAITALTIFAFFFFRRHYTLCLAASLLLGLFNLVYFTALQLRIGFYFGELSIGVNPILLLVALLTYLLNFQKANVWFFDLIKPSPAKIASLQQEEVTQFKERFAAKSTDELNRLITANKLVPAALTAARQLVRERT